MSEESWYSTIIREAVEGTSAADAVNAVMPGGMAVAGAVKAAADAAVGLGAVGSWSFDREEIEAIIADWKELAEQLKEDREAFLRVRNGVYPPSSDGSSENFVQALTDGLVALEESNSSMHKYVDDFIKKLEEAKSAISQGDEESARSFKGEGLSDV